MTLYHLSNLRVGDIPARVKAKKTSFAEPAALTLGKDLDAAPAPTLPCRYNRQTFLKSKQETSYR
jgi:hypothetical protein